MRRAMFALAVALLVTSLAHSTVHALNEPTHAIVNGVATETALFNSFLQAQAGLLRGFRQPFRGKTVSEWISEGGLHEDQGNVLDLLRRRARYLRHFHDPLQSWDTAGLSSRVFGQFESSVRWMQRADQGSQAVGGSWAWRDAREHYWKASTSSDPTAREQEFADTFRALGQIMHLVVDASVPEHVRNDAHPLEGICRFFGLRCYGNYEYWVSDQHPNAADEVRFRQTYLSNPIGFDSVILQQPTGDTQARVPIARLIDTRTYSGTPQTERGNPTDPNVTLTPAIGIGEFANANFFSEDTGGRSYPFPDVNRLVASQLPAPKSGRVRRYLAKGTGDGVPVDPALAECILYQPGDVEGVIQPITRTCVDENIWTQTAQHMLPRAVGYARGVLDYFFRGRIEIARPDRYVYALAPFLEGNAGAFTKLRFKVRNATPDEETSCQTGQTCPAPQLTAVVQYRTAAANLIDNPFAPISQQLFFAVSQPLPVTLTTSFQELVFDFSRSPLPANSADLFLTVVYRGPLGLENEAVMVGSKDLFEPDPLDQANITDYECFDGTLFHVADLSQFPPYNPPAQTQRDVNQDGIQDLFGPDVARSEFTKTFDLAQAFPTPSESNFDFRIAELSFTQYGRFMLLQDQPFYGAALLVREEQEIPSGFVLQNDFAAFAVDSVVNDVILGPSGEPVRRVSPSFLYRGVPTQHMILLLNNNTFPCLPQTPVLGPGLGRIEGTLPVE